MAATNKLIPDIDTSYAFGFSPWERAPSIKAGAFRNPKLAPVPVAIILTCPGEIDPASAKTNIEINTVTI